MTEHAANLQTYNQEFVKCIENLKDRREEVRNKIHEEKAQKLRLEKELAIINAQLEKLNKNLNHHTKIFEEYDNIIKESEASYLKILESSQVLLSLIKNKTATLTGDSD